MKFTYEELLDIFWRQIDPTDSGGQFFDRGESYETAIYYTLRNKSILAEESKEALDASGKFDKPIATKLLPAKTFYPAEEGHQNYYMKNPTHYNRYSIGSGRVAFKSDNWGDE